MPLDRRGALQLAVLILAVPTQYFVMKFLSTSEVQRDLALTKMVSAAANLRDRYLSWEYWQQLCAGLLPHVSIFNLYGRDRDQGESIAIEVLQFRQRNGHFATSLAPRTKRPIRVAYRVGQVIRHKTLGYRGVIVGWDYEAQAPESWLKKMFTAKNKGHQHSSHYLVLVDTRDRPYAQKTYVAQENVQILSNEKVYHPQLDDYLEDFDGSQYVPRRWLHIVYPVD